MLGAVLVLNPFRSLAVLLISLAVGLILQGVGEWTRWGRGSEESADGRGASPAGRLLDGAVGLVWVAGGVAVLAVPALTVVGLAVFVGGRPHRRWDGRGVPRRADPPVEQPRP